MKADLSQLLDSLLPDRCCQAFTIVLSILCVILGSLLTALMFSHSSEENNISYLGPSLLVIGALGLLTSATFLILRLIKKQKGKEKRKCLRKFKKLSPRNNPTIQNFQSFVKSFPFSEPSKDSESSWRMFKSQSSPRRSLKMKHFRLQHKTPHDLGASRQSSSPSVLGTFRQENSETPIIVIKIS